MRNGKKFFNEVFFSILVSAFGITAHACEFTVKLKEGSYISYSSNKNSIPFQVLASFVKKRLSLPDYVDVSFTRGGRTFHVGSTLSSGGYFTLTTNELDENELRRANAYVVLEKDLAAARNANVELDEVSRRLRTKCERVIYEKEQVSFQLQAAEREKEDVEAKCFRLEHINERLKRNYEEANNQFKRTAQQADSACKRAETLLQAKEEAIKGKKKAEAEAEKIRKECQAAVGWANYESNRANQARKDADRERLNAISLQQENKLLEQELETVREELTRLNQQAVEQGEAQVGQTKLNRLLDSTICSIKSLDCEKSFRGRNYQCAVDLCKSFGNSEDYFFGFEPAECDHSDCSKKDYCTFRRLIAAEYLKLVYQIGHHKFDLVPSLARSITDILDRYQFTADLDEYFDVIELFRKYLFMIVNLVPDLTQTQDDGNSFDKQVEARRNLRKLLEQLAEAIGNVSQEDYSE